jgi:hypothetical protein
VRPGVTGEEQGVRRRKKIRAVETSRRAISL